MMSESASVVRMMTKVAVLATNALNCAVCSRGTPGTNTDEVEGQRREEHDEPGHPESPSQTPNLLVVHEGSSCSAQLALSRERSQYAILPFASSGGQSFATPISNNSGATKTTLPMTCPLSSSAFA